MLATQETIKLMELLQENLIQGNFDMLRNIAEQPGIHPSIRDKMLAITKLFQQTILQSNIHEVDVFFYRDFLKEVMGGQISEANINNRLDITREKKEEAINILRRIRSSEQSRINAQIELKEKKKLVDSLRSKIELPSEVEKDYKSKQQKFAQIISQHEEQIQALKCNIQSQVEIIKESMVRQEESIDQLKRKQEEISRLKEKEKEKDKQIFKLKYQLTDIKQELQKSQLLLSQSNGKSQILSFQVSQKQEVLENLFKKESQYRSIIQSRTQESSRLKEENQLLRRQVEEAKASKAIKRRSTRQLFIDSNSLIQQFQMNEAAADSFNQTLTKKVGEVLSMSSLYNYTLHKAENFHKRVDSKNNILLLCLTKDNRIVGGFSSSGFSLKGEEHNSKAFLFSFYQDKMKVFDLKKGKKSTLYDSDFIIFGNEQLCIEKGSDVLTSYFVNGCSNALNYQYDKVSDRQQFISEVEAGKNSVQLLNYELIQLKIRND